METMIIERERVLGGRTEGDSGQHSRTLDAATSVVGNRPTDRTAEGTAVFVGKASFRMVAVGHEPNIDEVDTSGHQSLVTTASAGTASIPVTTTERSWFEAGDDNVVLTPPGTAIETRSLLDASAATRSGQVAARAARRGIPMWAIAASLVAGATITLSAQAVMRRPTAAVQTVVAPVATTATGNSAATLAVAPPVAMAPGNVPLPPTVVPTTVVWAVNGNPPFGQSGRALLSVRTRSARTARAQSRPVAETSPAVRARTVAWVDPFVAADASSGALSGTSNGASARDAHSAPRTGHASAVTSRRASASAQKATGWVDPFVQ